MRKDNGDKFLAAFSNITVPVSNKTKHALSWVLKIGTGPMVPDKKDID